MSCILYHCTQHTALLRHTLCERLLVIQRYERLALRALYYDQVTDKEFFFFDCVLK
jgi:hypothetical protein